MSKARIKKKLSLAGFYPSVYRHDRMWEKRMFTDPSYLIGSITGCTAPVKYSVCRVCAVHHPPDFSWDIWKNKEKK